MQVCCPGIKWLFGLISPTLTLDLAYPSTGTYLFLDADIEATVEYVKRCAQKARTGWLAATRIRDYVAGAIDEFQPENAGIVSSVVLLMPYVQLVVQFYCTGCHTRLFTLCRCKTLSLLCAGPALNGNLEISVTTVPWFRNVRVKHFEDNTKVKNAILASACIVPPPLYLRGHGWAIDGAFSDFQILKVMHELWYVTYHGGSWQQCAVLNMGSSMFSATCSAKIKTACLCRPCLWVETS